MRRLTLLIAFVLLLASVAQAAIDTANKRASVIPHDGPIPDASLADAGDRAQMLNEYRGLFDSAPVSTGGTSGGGGAILKLTIRRGER